MVEEAHRQLRIMHGVEDRDDIPPPCGAAYRDWGEDPFGGGANFWHLHVDSEQVFRQILQPVENVPVYICGEAYSHDQGWVEGALATADAMLQAHFGLQPPPWISQSRAQP
jgi:monoamine oxidase